MHFILYWRISLQQSYNIQGKEDLRSGAGGLVVVLDVAAEIVAVSSVDGVVRFSTSHAFGVASFNHGVGFCGCG